MREELELFWKFINASDEAFFEEYLSDLSEEELAKFLEENPEFLKD